MTNLAWSEVYFFTSWPISWTKLALDHSQERRKIYRTTRENVKVWDRESSRSPEVMSIFLRGSNLGQCARTSPAVLIFDWSISNEAVYRPHLLIWSTLTRPWRRATRQRQTGTHCYDCSGRLLCRTGMFACEMGFWTFTWWSYFLHKWVYYGGDYLNCFAVSLQPGYRLSNGCWWEKIPRGNCGGAARAPLLFIHFETVRRALILEKEWCWMLGDYSRWE